MIKEVVSLWYEDVISYTPAWRRRGEIHYPATNNLYLQNVDVLPNPKNPKIRDAEIGIKGKIKWNPVGEKKRGIASLQGL